MKEHAVVVDRVAESVYLVLLWRWWARLRARLGAAILGRGWLGVMMRHALIAERSRDCITPDGHVVLARCKPLADALYADIPGNWTLTVTSPATHAIPVRLKAGAVNVRKLYVKEPVPRALFDVVIQCGKGRKNADAVMRFVRHALAAERSAALPRHERGDANG